MKHIPNHFLGVLKLNEEIGLSGGSKEGNLPLSVESDLFRKSAELHGILIIM